MTIVKPETTTPLADIQIREGSLTQRALLTFISNLLQQGARFLVAFIATPIIIRGLGSELYGAWVIIQQVIGYLSLSDLRPMGTLKFTLAVRQHDPDVSEKQRQIGASLLLWAVTFPIMLLIGAISIWYSPSFIHTTLENVRSVQVALGIVFLSVALERILSLPANVLQGQNLAYKAIGLNTITIFLSGLISVVVIWAGWGLPGIAVASVLGVVLSNLIRFFVARRAISWLAAARPTRSEFISFSKLSGWLFFSALAGLLLNTTDLLLVGMFSGPTAAAVYATTGAVLRLTSEPLAQLLSSGNAGLAGLCGQGQWSRVVQLRTKMHQVALMSLTAIGAGVLALNKSFLTLWIGEGFFGGMPLTLVLLLIAILSLLFRIDAIIVDSLLYFRQKAWAMLVGGLMGLVVSVGLLPIWGSLGVAVGISFGYMIVIGYFWWLFQRKLSISLASYGQEMMRPTILSITLLLLAYMISSRLTVHNWGEFGFFASSIGSVTFITLWIWGLSSEARAIFLQQVRPLLHYSLSRYKK